MAYLPILRGCNVQGFINCGLTDVGRINLTVEKIRKRFNLLFRPRHKAYDRSNEYGISDKIGLLTGRHLVFFESVHVPVAGMPDNGKDHHSQFIDVDANIAIALDTSDPFKH